MSVSLRLVHCGSATFRFLIVGCAVALTLVSAGPAGAGACADGTWTDLNPDSTVRFTTARFEGVDFIDESTGVIVGSNGTIFYTTDRGDNWLGAVSGTAEDLDGVDFIDATYATAVGYDGTILRSSDGCATWSPQDGGTGQDLFDVVFVDALTGWVVGRTGTILKTTDGGATWDDQSSTEDHSLFAAFFFDAQKGFVASGNGIILATTNGGASWAHNATGQLCGGHWSGLCNIFRDICFLDESTGFAVGYPSDVVVLVGGSFRKTVNGGGQWFEPPTSIPNFDLKGFEAVAFGNSTDGMLLGEVEANYCTDDGGVTWTEMTMPKPGYSRALCYGDANTAYAVGFQGTILRWDRSVLTPVEKQSWGSIKSIYRD
jgi:photosystem II stability/assembly factor-like uncharacterized protein